MYMCIHLHSKEKKYDEGALKGQGKAANVILSVYLYVYMYSFALQGEEVRRGSSQGAR